MSTKVSVGETDFGQLHSITKQCVYQQSFHVYLELALKLLEYRSY